MVFEYSSIALRKRFLALYTYIRPDTSIRQLDVEIDVAYETVYRRDPTLREQQPPKLSHHQSRNL